MTGNIQDSHEALVRQAVQSVRKADIANSVDHVLKQLR